MEQWDSATGYELYVGRWSRAISVEFVNWLQPRSNLKWLEIGCGTGALTQAIAENCSPSYLLAIDKSKVYIEQARRSNNLNCISFFNKDINSFKVTDDFDNITSGLVLNFIPDIATILKKLLKKLKSGGQLSAFVWDYAGHYQPMRFFWDAAKEVTPGAELFDPGKKFANCTENGLIGLLQELNLEDIQFSSIDKIATFNNFDDYWLPIAAAQGSVSEFINLLTPDEIAEVKQSIKRKLPIAANGQIKMVISSLAVKAQKR